MLLNLFDTIFIICITILSLPRVIFITLLDHITDFLENHQQSKLLEATFIAEYYDAIQSNHS